MVGGGEKGPSISKTEGEDDMKGVTPKKICIRCGEEYEPTSNVQKRCKKCQEIWKVEKNKKSSGKKPVPLNKQCSVPGCEKYKVRNGMCIEHDKEARLQLSLDNTESGDETGKISQPENDIIGRLLSERQTHIDALVEIQGALKTLRKYGAAIPDEAISA